MRGFLASFGALALATNSVMAHAGPVSAPVEQSNQLADTNALFFYVGIAVVIAAIVLLVKDEDEPVSA